jgi:hypothetical protein
MVDQGQREALARRLAAHARAVAELLEKQPLEALAGTRALGAAVEDVLHVLVREARAEGHTWQAIGDALHTTRQAAFQRFGRVLRAPGREVGDDDSSPPDPGSTHSV